MLRRAYKCRVRGKANYFNPANMDFGDAQFVKSKFLKQQLLVIQSERKVGFCYKFAKNTQSQFVCLSCKKLGKYRSVTVREGRIVCKKHPEDDHHEQCEPVPQSEIDALEMDRDMRHSVRDTGKRPRDAFNDTVTSIAKRFKSSEEQADVIVRFPAFSEVRRQLSRHRSSQHIPVPNPLDIPSELRVTQRGKKIFCI